MSDREIHVLRFVHLLGQYIGFVQDHNAEEFSGHYKLEDEINFEAGILGFEKVFIKDEQFDRWATADGCGSIRAPWETILKNWGDIREKGYTHQPRVFFSIWRPRGMGNMFHSCLWPKLARREKDEICSMLREWQRMADEPVISKPKVPKPNRIEPKGYEKDAYLSYVKAIQENPRLATADFNDIHSWIKTNGVEIEGKPYRLPAFRTWRKYRGAGEKFAKSNSQQT